MASCHERACARGFRVRQPVPRLLTVPTSPCADTRFEHFYGHDATSHSALLFLLEKWWLPTATYLPIAKAKGWQKNSMKCSHLHVFLLQRCGQTMQADHLCRSGLLAATLVLRGHSERQLAPHCLPFPTKINHIQAKFITKWTSRALDLRSDGALLHKGPNNKVELLGCFPHSQTVVDLIKTGFPLCTLHQNAHLRRPRHCFRDP